MKQFFHSSIGRKFIVAITGLFLLLFVTIHLLGNLSIFLGPVVMNAYAARLHQLGALLWIARLGLIALVGLHLFFTLTLWKENRAASPRAYARDQILERTLYARSMRLSGLVILGFLLFHLAQFTWKWTNPEYQQWQDSLGQHNVYRMVTTAFHNPWVSGFYLLSVGLLAMHLAHGIESLFQTLGLTNQKFRYYFQCFGRFAACFFFLGYASIPVAVFLKMIPSS